MSRGRSSSPRPLQEADVDMNGATAEADPSKKDAKVVIITNLTRNVVESHLRTIFGFYGQITKIDLPLYANSGQNRGKAALEYVDAESANKAASHMDGGQLDGAIVKVELSNLPVRSRSRSPRPTRPIRNGRPKSYSRSRTHSLSRSRSRSPAPRRRSDFRDSYRGGRGAGFGGRRGPPGRGPYRPRSPRSRSRSLSPVRRPSDRLPPRRRSPSYSRGGYGRSRRSRSRSYSVRSSRSRTRSVSRSRSRSRSRSYSSYSRYSRSRSRTRSRTRSRSVSRGRRSLSRDDIRDSKSRSPPPAKD